MKREATWLYTAKVLFCSTIFYANLVKDGFLTTLARQKVLFHYHP